MPDLHHHITVQAPPQKAYEAIATPEGLGGWWTADAHADSKAGGREELSRAMADVMTRVNALDRDVRERIDGSNAVVQRHTHGEWPAKSAILGYRQTLDAIASTAGRVVALVHEAAEAGDPAARDLRREQLDLTRRVAQMIEAIGEFTAIYC